MKLWLCMDMLGSLISLTSVALEISLRISIKKLGIIFTILQPLGNQFIIIKLLLTRHY